MRKAAKRKSGSQDLGKRAERRTEMLRYHLSSFLLMVIYRNGRLQMWNRFIKFTGTA